MPNDETMTKHELNKISSAGISFLFRHSDFVIPSGFDIRHLSL